MFKVSRSAYVLSILLFVFLATQPQSSRAQELSEIVLLSVDASQFPDIEVTFRAVDATGQVPATLINDNIDLFENDQLITDFELVKGDISPATVLFVIDRGYYSNLPAYNRRTLQQSVNQFIASGQFRDGIDTVAIYSRINNTQGPPSSDGGAPSPGSPRSDELRTVLGPTQSASTFSAAISNLDFSRSNGSTRELLGVDEALTTLINMGVAENSSTAVIFMTSVVQWPSVSQTTRTARDLGIRAQQQQTAVYTLHGHTEAQFADPLRTLAQTSGGQYLHLSTDAEENVDGLNQIYERIISQGQTYTLRYRSHSADGGTHTVSLAPKGEPPNSKITYSINLQPPTIAITSPRDNFTQERKNDETAEDVINYEPDSIKIMAELTDWPDGLSRNIASVEFFADGLSVLRKENPAGTLFEHELDISTITESKAIPVLVKVVDELGIESESRSITLNIDVEIAESIIVQQPTPGPSPTPIIVVKSICEENPDLPECVTDRVASIVPWIIAGVSGLMFLGVLILYRRRVSEFAGNAGQIIRERAADVRKTILGGGGVRGKTVLAKLHVLNARKDLIGGEVKIYTTTTTLGRNPKLCDIQLFDEDDASSVSGQHCTILYDMGRFTITDDNSANGTEVNGQMIPPNEPIPLNNDDEIVLGDLFRRGAKVRFEIVEQPKEAETAVSTIYGQSNDDSTWGDITILDDEGDASRETLYDLEPDDPFADDDFTQPTNKNPNWLDDLE